MLSESNHQQDAGHIDDVHNPIGCNRILAEFLVWIFCSVNAYDWLCHSLRTGVAGSYQVKDRQTDRA